MRHYTLEERQLIRKKWIARMHEWQNSSLTGAAWCRQKKYSYHQFIYWKSRLFAGVEQNPDPNSFIELDDQRDSTGIEIVFNETSIRLSKDFDSSTLLRCIEALRKAKC